MKVLSLPKTEGRKLRFERSSEIAFLFGMIVLLVFLKRIFLYMAGQRESFLLFEFFLQ